MTTPARRYARYRWAVYSKIGLIIFAQKGLSGLFQIIYSKPNSRDLHSRILGVENALEHLRQGLLAHLAYMKATGSWKTL